VWVLIIGGANWTGDCASGEIVLTTGTGFIALEVTCIGCVGWDPEIVAPQVLQKTVPSAFLLPQAEHCNMV